MSSVIAGFSGTKEGMSASQQRQLRDLLEELEVAVLHLGDCVGADAEAHEIATGMGISTIGHPPIDSKHRAYCDYDEEREPKEFLERNHDIVDESEVLIAAPLTRKEVLRSGTWATIRYALKGSGGVIKLWP